MKILDLQKAATIIIIPGFGKWILSTFPAFQFISCPLNPENNARCV